jgi:hypothetical protein
MEKTRKRDRDDDEDRRPEKRGADGETVLEEPPKKKQPKSKPTEGNSGVDLSYLGAGAEAEQAVPLTEPERGADGEYTRARAIGALEHRLNCERCGFQDYNADLHFIDQLQATVIANRRAWNCPRCRGLTIDLQVQMDLRKQEQLETKRAEAYCRASDAYAQDTTRELVAALRKIELLELKMDKLEGRSGRK